MDPLMKKILDAAGVSGYEKEIARILSAEFRKLKADVHIDNFGNVIAKKGNGKKKIMIAAHMDEIGLIVKHITNEGYLKFIKVGGIDNKILLGRKVIVKTKKSDVVGIIGAKPPHIQREDDKKNSVSSHEDMFIDIGCKDKKQAQTRVEVGDSIIFAEESGILNTGLVYGRAVDDRVGCYALLKIMEKIKVNAEVFAVATVQEEVGLKGARTASFKINPDFAIAIDTTLSGDTPHIKETDSSLKLGQGPAITFMEASGRGVIVNEKIRNLFIETARKNKIRYQIDMLEGGMTDGAIIYMNREGIATGVLSIPSRYVHSPVSVFSISDVDETVKLALRVIERVAAGK